MKTKVARFVVSAITAMSLLAIQTPAYASSACLGCNVRDEGTFNNSLVGQTVYIGSDTYQVTAIDRTSGYAYLTDRYGAPRWSFANETYSVGAQRERNNVTAGVSAVSAIVLLSALLGGSGKSSSSSYRNTGKNSSRKTEYVYRQVPTYESPSPSKSPSPSITQYSSGLHGNCHGGSFYSC
jgi:hypothetical protein